MLRVIRFFYAQAFYTGGYYGRLGDLICFMLSGFDKQACLHFFPFRDAHLCFSRKQICALTRIKYVLLRRTHIFSLSEMCFSRKQICASMRSKFVLVLKALFPFRGVHPCSLKQICAFTRKNKSLIGRTYFSPLTIVILAEGNMCRHVKKIYVIYH